MKILLVHNNLMRWADTFRAEQFKKHWTEDEVDIASAMEPMPEGDKYDVIHFLYSGGLTKQRKYFLKYKDKVFTSLASQRTLDFMFDKKQSLVEIFQNSQGTVCHNTILHRKLLELIGFGYSDKVVYIPNGVDTELFNRKFTAGFVCAKGSNQHKGIHLARKACRELGIELIEAHASRAATAIRGPPTRPSRT